MRNLLLFGQVLILGAGQIASCDAASFNCTPYIERRACPELVICSEPNLSRLDEVMASLYETARLSMQNSLTPEFRQYQREWLAKRAECGCSYDCLDEQYRAQIKALRRTIQEMGQ